VHFGFSGEQEEYRKSVRDFLEKEVKPQLKTGEALTEFPRELWRQIGAFGLLGIGFPEEFGGKPGGSILRGIVAEEMGRIDLSLAFTLISAYGTVLAILYGGSYSQKEDWVPGLIQGQILGSVGMTEPDCGSDLSSIRMTAIKDNDDYVLNGEKSYVSWGAVADIIWVFCRTEKDIAKNQMTTFLVPLDMHGITKYDSAQMGMNSVEHCALFFDDVRIPARYELGNEGNAYKLAAKVFPHTRMILSLSALGLAQVTLEETITFAQRRTAFGEPLGKFEAVSFKIAERSTLLESAIWLCYRTLWLLEQGRRCIKEVAMCKWWSSELTVKIIRDALILHGHIGYSTKLPFERRYRDIIGYEIAEATPQILKLTISEEIFSKHLRPFC
jgi:cyclohexanecarboxyl-CoA dehydrogenase